MRFISVVGARPQFIKLSPVHRALVQAGHEHSILHTGQHYEHGMSAVFFDELALPSPDRNLGVGSGSHGAQTGAMLTGIETEVLDRRPDWVIVYGDTNTTLAAALAASKQRVAVAHVEAGLRSFDRQLPEELNRVLVDHGSDALLAPTPAAMHQLEREGLADRSVLVGDVMVDAFKAASERVRVDESAGRLDESVLSEPFVLATIHRDGNTDDPVRLRAILEALAELDVKVVLPVHPRLRDRARDAGLELRWGAVHPIDPLGYLQLVRCLRTCDAVVTDSGGLQKEAYLAARPCTTLRHTTEWPETLDNAWNVLAGDLVDLPTLICRPRPDRRDADVFGTGEASRRIVEALELWQVW